MMWKIILATLAISIGLLAIIGLATLYIIIATIQNERDTNKKQSE